MKNLKVVLCDREEVFVLGLMNYVNRNPRIPILLMAFTNAEEAIAYVKAHRPDLLVAERTKETVKMAACISVSVLWILNGEEKKTDQESFSAIERYLPASAYVRRMLQKISEEEYRYHTGNDCICGAVYAPVGGCGKTALAHELCRSQILQNLNSGVGCIYLGWEEFPEYPDESNRMEELLYYVKQRADNISMKMKALAAERPDYDCIPGAMNYQELRELKKEDVRWLLDSVRAEGYYGFLIADIGSASFADLEVLAEFDMVYLPYQPESRHMHKLETFCRGMQKQGLWERFGEICYPVDMSKGLPAGEAGRLEQSRRQGKLSSIATMGLISFGQEEAGEGKDTNADRKILE